MKFPYEFETRGLALTAAMTMIGSTRKKLKVVEIVNRFKLRYWVVLHSNGAPAITYDTLTA